MIVAGIGFRAEAPLAALQEALQEALARAGGAVQALATEAGKARAPQAVALARALDLPLIAIAAEELARQETPSRSPRVAARFGTGSLAEAAALAGAGPGARLRGPRVVSADGMATAAIAEGPDT
ncbi:cobalamin biosynthesis protein [Acidimangrovimonas pyrenivorans]|uniref:Cobalamin biosynthesis protein n=1 Tax=Acidimangrovimonas pyrenivorans TaxID=2030798 RepID=A0ABV7AI94_9RHOB